MVAVLGVVKRLNRKCAANFATWVTRTIGPFLPEHSIRRNNLRAAFPQKSAAEIERILSGVRDNFGRVAIEFAHLDDFCLANIGPQTPEAITFTPEVKKGTCWSTSTMPEALR